MAYRNKVKGALERYLFTKFHEIIKSLISSTWSSP